MALDWTLDLFFSKDLVQFLTHRAPSISELEAHARRPPEDSAKAEDRPLLPLDAVRQHQARP